MISKNVTVGISSAVDEQEDVILIKSLAVKENVLIQIGNYVQIITIEDLKLAIKELEDFLATK